MAAMLSASLPFVRYLVLIWITSIGTAYDAEFIHFHDVSVYIVESLQPVSAASVEKCSEHCYYKGDKCVAFEHHEDGKCLMHTIIEYNGTTMPDLYIKNVKQIQIPTYCHTDEFAQEIISNLGILPCSIEDQYIHYCKPTKKCYLQWNDKDSLSSGKYWCATEPYKMTLAVINSKKDDDCRQEIYTPRNAAHFPYLTWLTRENVTAPWQRGNGDPVNYTNWAPGQPTNSGNCMVVTNGTWSTYECSGGPSVSVLCQRTAYSP